MSVSMRLKRFGTKKRPYYRVVVQETSIAAKGKTLEEIGFYHPIEAEDAQVKINAERAQYWLSCGVKPSATVKALLAKQGIQASEKAPVKD